MNTNEKLREALAKADKALARISKSAWFLESNFAETIEVMKAGNAIEEALALPRRNCDVGTAEEQVERFFNFCKRRKSCDLCPSNSDSVVECAIKWSQMPYEEVKE